MSEVSFRLAQRQDLSSIVRMLADDDLGSQRERYEDPLPGSYFSAFEQIENDPNHELIVAELDGEVVGTLHLMFLPSISYQGGLRAQVESVRVDRKHQNQGIGSEMMKWSVERARARDAHLVQLTTHRSREDAHRFYERLGFTKSHLGMKLNLK
ncbi:MAG: GNAT family N-acetyltransferase [Anaerolineales bacterium]|nr:GNAT family N-acetyltransferase [Anaerolineae bacterium]PWB68782.1 MAG: GNAT family N-acetyltransferase [Anaerolineales bacterium]